MKILLLTMMNSVLGQVFNDFFQLSTNSIKSLNNAAI